MDRVSAPNSFSFADLQVIGKNNPSKSDNLQDAVVQFESLFVNMMLKSMRDANALLAEGSYLNSSEIQMHQGMLDQQLAVHLSEQGGIGLAEPLLRQLGGGLEKDNGQVTPPGLLKQPVAENLLTAKSQGANTPIANTPIANTQVAKTQDLQPSTSFSSPMEFLDKLLPTFTSALADSPINPLTALAQAALETGWGVHQMQQADGKSAHNLFGIKASNWSGPTAQAQTMEFLQGRPIQQQQSFRAYDDWSQSVQDYAKLVGTSPRYTSAVEQAQNPAAYLQGLQDAGYATDPKYADKILDVLDNIKQMLSR